jgi:predicted short-subunit dehydrogenase-like oxidoreductase (DUF2520 family)
MRELERKSTNAAGVRADGGSLPALTIVGRGRAGGSIAAAARAAGLEVRIAGRDDAVALSAGAEVVLLCVPDGEIAAAAEAVCAADPPPRFLGHTSGALGINFLAPVLASGGSAFGLHPLQTLPDTRSDLTDAPCAVSGSDPEALALATNLAERLGMRPVGIDESHRAAYHAAASMASNFLVTLEESACELLEAGGIEDGRALLAPLVKRTADNWSSLGAAALTGPIARGDEETVARHRAALAESAPQLLPLYDELAARTRDLAKEPVG